MGLGEASMYGGPFGVWGALLTSKLVFQPFTLLAGPLEFCGVILERSGLGCSQGKPPIEGCPPQKKPLGVHKTCVVHCLTKRSQPENVAYVLRPQGWICSEKET